MVVRPFVFLKKLGGFFAVASVFYVVVRSLNVGGLLADKLMDGQWQVGFERFVVGSFGVVLALFCAGEKGRISAAHLGFEVAPGAVQCS